MGWTTLTLRKTGLIPRKDNLELEDMHISRSVRKSQRESSFNETSLKRKQKRELAAIKEDYYTVRDDERPEIGSDDYAEWQQNYYDAKEDYQAQKLEIDEYYEDLLNELEEEQTEFETEKSEEQATVEAQLEAVRDELESVKEQIKTDIQDQTVKFS